MYYEALLQSFSLCLSAKALDLSSILGSNVGDYGAIIFLSLFILSL